MKTKIMYTFLALVIIACSDNDTPTTNNGNSNSGPWLIPISEIKDGGPGKDGIPSIDAPDFTDANSATFLNDDDLVIGIADGNEAKAYAHSILNWHEVLNDEINGEFVTINYCPLTGTAFGWNSEVNGQRTTFGVSGLLYNANLILYDRNTDSNWSQMRLECVNGTLIENRPTLTKVIETDWKTWKTLYPNTQVLTTNTGFSRNYNLYPYGDYQTNNDRFIFQVSPRNNAIPNKERVFTIINNEEAKVYQFSKFNNGNAIKDSFNGQNYLIVGNENLIYAYELSTAQSNATFEYDFNSTEGVFFKDDAGNTWSVFGEALSGPQAGDILKSPKSVVSFWFATASFYPNPEIYSEL